MDTSMANGSFCSQFQQINLVTILHCCLTSIHADIHHRIGRITYVSTYSCLDRSEKTEFWVRSLRGLFNFQRAFLHCVRQCQSNSLDKSVYVRFTSVFLFFPLSTGAMSGVYTAAMMAPCSTTLQCWKEIYSQPVISVERSVLLQPDTFSYAWLETWFRFALVWYYKMTVYEIKCWFLISLCWTEARQKAC